MRLKASCRCDWAIVGQQNFLQGMFQQAEAAAATSLILFGGYL